ncbi:MAG: hypothetical protein IKM59_06855 [Oscillospiraceae bacterium]|nr:hypothetical protein [Oscillospiraceae bacterium]
MQHESFRQLIDTMESSDPPYDYKEEIREIEKKKEAFSVKETKAFLLTEHIRTMVYAQLSNNRKWQPIAENMEYIDRVFGNFDPEYIKHAEASVFVESLLKRRCGNRQIRKQMEHLKSNVETLERIERDHGSIDAYYGNHPLVTVIKSLSEPYGRYKLKCMGVPLVCEYLKGLGLEVVKPDTLLCRLLGRLGYTNSPMEPASHWEAIEICKDIGRVYGLSQTMVDTVLWQYCAKDKFEVCTAKPKCESCKVLRCQYREMKDK